MKKAILILVIFFTNLVFSQKSDFNKPDYKLISKNIENKNSNFFYQNLLKKLSENDTLISKEEYFHLYYGAALQKDYNPYKKSKFEDELNKYYKELEEKDYDKFIALANKSLKEYPLDLRLMNFLAYTHHMKHNDAMAEKISKNFHGLIAAIMSTGDGITCENGLHVISVTHEYVVLNLFELEVVSQSLVENCDYMSFEKDKYKVAGLYFDVSKLFEKQKMMFEK
ncbi:MAG: DUF4919 domain-containing protein [Bacteroidota bacterium]